MDDRRIRRSTLVRVVDDLASHLRRNRDREAVQLFARTADRFAAGAWTLDGCHCPITGVGIDRLRRDARVFANQFDYQLGVAPEDPYTFAVVDAPGSKDST